MKQRWYAPHEIYFSAPQIIFILENLELLEAGQYPRQVTGYIDQPDVLNFRVGRSGRFTRPVEIAAEVNIRVKTCGYDGALLRGRFQFDQSVTELSEQYQKPEWVIYMRISRALRYCSGWKRRQIPYNLWCAGQRFLTKRERR